MLPFNINKQRPGTSRAYILIGETSNKNKEITDRDWDFNEAWEISVISHASAPPTVKKEHVLGNYCFLTLESQNETHGLADPNLLCNLELNWGELNQG